MTRWFVHLAADDEFAAHERAAQHGRVVQLETEVAPDGRTIYGSAEVVPREPEPPCE